MEKVRSAWRQAHLWAPARVRPPLLPLPLAREAPRRRMRGQRTQASNRFTVERMLQARHLARKSGGIGFFNLWKTLETADYHPAQTCACIECSRVVARRRRCFLSTRRRSSARAPLGITFGAPRCVRARVRRARRSGWRSVGWRSSSRSSAACGSRRSRRARSRPNRRRTCPPPYLRTRSCSRCNHPAPLTCESRMPQGVHCRRRPPHPPRPSRAPLPPHRSEPRRTFLRPLAPHACPQCRLCTLRPIRLSARHVKAAAG